MVVVEFGLPLIAQRVNVVDVDAIEVIGDLEAWEERIPAARCRRHLRAN